MKEAEAKLPGETPPGGSRVETLRRLFEGDASSKMALDPQEVDTGSSGSSGPTAYRRRKGKGKTPERSQWPAGGHPHDFFTASDGDERGRGVAGIGGGDVPMEPEGENEDHPPPYRSSESSACGTETPRWGDMDENDDMDVDYRKKPPSSDPQRRPGGDPPGPPGGGPSGPLEDPHQVDPLEADNRAGEDPLDRADPAEALLENPWEPRRPDRER